MRSATTKAKATAANKSKSNPRAANNSKARAVNSSAKRATPKNGAKATAVPPPASRPGDARLVATGRIRLDRDVREILARLHYHLLAERKSPRVEDAKVTIAWRRVEDAFRRLGTLPMELVAAWAVAGDPPPQRGDAEDLEGGFSPENASMATDHAVDSLRDTVPEGFVALQLSDTRDAYLALVTDALDPDADEPYIATVQFIPQDDDFDIDNEMSIAEWLHEMIVEQEPPLEVPPAFIAAFEVSIV